MKKSTRIIAIALLTLLLLSLASCSPFTVREGFDIQLYVPMHSNYRFPVYSHMCAYEASRFGYSKDSVTLDVSFGSVFADNLADEIDDGRNIEYAELYVEDGAGELHLISRTDGAYTSEEYRCTLETDDPNSYDAIVSVNYSHSEKVTLPAEVFADECGKLRLKVYGKYSDREEICELSYINLYYKVSGERVEIGNEPF